MLTDRQKDSLKKLAIASIRHGLETGQPLQAADFKHQQQGEIDLPDFPGAVFVTLNKSGQLRGCIGSLEAYRSLSEDVAENAFAAAFRDYRFNPLAADELSQLDISLSVLTEPELMAFSSEQDLISQLQPGVDGMILTEGSHRGTFLPSVWEYYPAPDAFLSHLKMKAGLPADYWSDTIKIERYKTVSW